MGQAGHKKNLADLRSCVEKTTQLLLKTLIFKPILKFWVFFFQDLSFDLLKRKQALVG